MKKLLFISIVLLIAVFLVNYLSVAIQKDDRNQNFQFTPYYWNAVPEKRIFIVDDLLKNYNLQGMNKNEIIELLGENECLKSKHNSFIYTLGSENQIMFNFSKYLEIRFDSNNNVISYRIYQD